MPWMKSLISFFNESLQKIIKQKARYLHTMHKPCDVIVQWRFSMKLRKKSSIHACHEWRVWSHFSMNLSIKLSNKKLGTYIPLTTHAMSFFNEDFPWNCEKKPIPTCHEWRVWSHFSMNLSIKLSNKKLVTYIPCRNHAMSFFNENFHEIAKKKKLETYMPWMKNMISFFNQSFLKIIQKMLFTRIPSTKLSWQLFPSHGQSLQKTEK